MPIILTNESYSFSPFRVRIWYHHIVPPILAFLIILINLNWEHFRVTTIFLFLTTLFSTATLGYFINDWSDIESDRLGGKRNKVHILNKKFRFLVFLILLFIAFIPWFFLKKLPHGNIALAFWIFEIFILIIYAAPPFRLKNRGYLGALCDALYAHVIPIVIVFFIFTSKVHVCLFDSLILFGILFIKGLRNIIIHQIEDRHPDFKGDINSLVLKIGISNSIKLINFILIPFEVLLVFTLLIFYSRENTIYLNSFILFIIWKLLYFNFYNPIKNVKHNQFWYILNDYYEGWFLYFAAFSLIIDHNLSVLYIFIVVLAFYKPMGILLAEWQMIKTNLTINFKYFRTFIKITK